MRVLAGSVCVLLVVIAVAGAEEEDPLRVGRGLLGGPEHERGVAMLTSVIAEAEKSPESVERQLRAGQAHFYLERDREALAAFERAAALDPKSAEVVFWQGLAHVYQKDAEAKALAAFQRAVALDPEHGRAWLELGRLHERVGNTKEALPAFERAAELMPDHAQAHFLLAVQLDAAGRSADARPRLERALELEPDHVLAGYNLGLNHQLAGRFEAARDVWVRMAAHAPDDLQLHAKIVQAHFALERYDEAGTWRKRVFEIRAASKDDDTRKRKDYCFDQFKVGDLRVFAYERFEPQPTEEMPIGYLYVFYVRKEDKEVRRIQVEISKVFQELGGPPYVLCAVLGDEHRTYDLVWREPPAYPELKAAVLKAMRDEVRVAASSRLSTRTITVDTSDR
jgi:tetratricopeptide (TPR) repeat protein